MRAILIAATLAAAGTIAAVAAPRDSILAGTAVSGCRAVDGDTLRCGELRVRLAEIDAPEMPGHCRAGRVCAPGDPYASKAALQAALGAGNVRVRKLATDRYGRTVAAVTAGGKDLSCAQVRGGYAIAQLKWGDYGVLRRACPGF